ncbi:MAG: DUF1365 family protein, partial [Betaproteobacteria bacterium]|nr:DUF1365 family protein [Betaproteobacteria bacterium]
MAVHPGAAKTDVAVTEGLVEHRPIRHSQRRGICLRAVLAEVSNTFGERHNYWVMRADHAPISAVDRLPAHKVFHVSPFFPVSGEYQFVIDLRDTLCAVVIDYLDGGELHLATRIAGRLEPLDATGVWRWVLGFPLLTIGVVWRIHWQALR